MELLDSKSIGKCLKSVCLRSAPRRVSVGCDQMLLLYLDDSDDIDDIDSGKGKCKIAQSSLFLFFKAKIHFFQLFFFSDRRMCQVRAHWVNIMSNCICAMCV